MTAAADDCSTAAEQYQQGYRYRQNAGLFGGELQLPADALFGKERGPATLPGVGLGSGKVVIKIQTKLRLIAPLMQMGDLLA
jgi:hypothetical protein